MPGLKDRLTDAGYGLGWSVVCRLPESWAQTCLQVLRRPGVAAPGPWGAGAGGQPAPGDRGRGGRRPAAGPVQGGDALVRALLARGFPAAGDAGGRLAGGMRDTGHVRAALEYLAAGRGVVFALPHMGNYDLAGAWVIAQGAGSITTVAERLKPESVYDRFVAFREGLGVEVLPASGGAFSAFGILAQRLRAGKLVALVCDRDVTGAGMEVEFFGEKARMMGGPAALAVQTGAALMPVILWFEGDDWGAHVHEEIPVPAEGDREQQAAAMTQEVARLFEAGIRAHPQDWHMLQRVFVADLDAERLRRAAGS